MRNAGGIKGAEAPDGWDLFEGRTVGFRRRWGIGMGKGGGLWRGRGEIWKDMRGYRKQRRDTEEKRNDAEKEKEEC